MFHSSYTKMIKDTLFRFYNLKTSLSCGDQTGGTAVFCNYFFVLDYIVKIFGVLKSGTIDTLTFTVI